MAPKLLQVFTRKKKRQASHSPPVPTPPPSPPHDPIPPQEPQPEPVNWEDLEGDEEEQGYPYIPPPSPSRLDPDYQPTQEEAAAAANEPEEPMDVDEEPQREANLARVDLQAEPIEYPPNSEAANRYILLSKKKFEQTRLLDPKLLDQMGFKAQFFELLHQVGVKPEFWKIKERAYTRLTMEVLCTLSGAFNTHSELYEITFQICDQWYVLDENQFAKYMGLEFGGGVDSPIIQPGLWKLLADEEPSRDGTMRSSRIQHPLLRCIQRWLSLSIFAKGEGGIKANQQQLTVLDHILRPMGPQKLNIPALMMKHWLSVATNKRAGAGQITLGSYITHLAKKLGVTQFGEVKSGGPRTCDMAYMASMGHVVLKSGTYYWIYGHFRVPLPFTYPIVVGVPETYLLCTKGQTRLRNFAREETQGGVEEAEEAEEAEHEQPGVDREEARADRPEAQHFGEGSSSWQPPTGTFWDNYEASFLEMQRMQISMNTRLEAMERRQEEEIAAQQAWRTAQEGRFQRYDNAYTYWENYMRPPPDN